MLVALVAAGSNLPADPSTLPRVTPSLYIEYNSESLSLETAITTYVVRYKICGNSWHSAELAVSYGAESADISVIPSFRNWTMDQAVPNIEATFIYTADCVDLLARVKPGADYPTTRVALRSRTYSSMYEYQIPLTVPTTPPPCGSSESLTVRTTGPVDNASMSHRAFLPTVLIMLLVDFLCSR